jgi:hypothetical protein
MVSGGRYRNLNRTLLSTGEQAMNERMTVTRRALTTIDVPKLRRGQGRKALKLHQSSAHCGFTTFQQCIRV